MRTETAQALLDSVFYTLGIALKDFPTPDAALQGLKSRPLAALLTEGQDCIRRRVAAARARHRRLAGALFETENVFYRATAADGIRGFFRLYRPALFANETHITADYPLLLPLFFGLDGVLYSMPVSDVLTAIVSAGIIAKTYRQLNTAQNVN